MKSPFPGMDPYLESRWGDVHAGLCTAISAALQPILPQDLRCRICEELQEFDLVDDGLSLDTPADRWLQIIETSDGNRVITAIEILRPSKGGGFHERYRKRRDRYIEARVNVVEIFPRSLKPA